MKVFLSFLKFMLVSILTIRYNHHQLGNNELNLKKGTKMGLYYSVYDNELSDDNIVKVGSATNPNSRHNLLQQEFSGLTSHWWSLFNHVKKSVTHTYWVEKAVQKYYSEFTYAVDRSVGTSTCWELFKNIPEQRLIKGMAAVAWCSNNDICKEYDIGSEDIVPAFFKLASELSKEARIIQLQKLRAYESMRKQGFYKMRSSNSVTLRRGRVTPKSRADLPDYKGQTYEEIVTKQH